MKILVTGATGFLGRHVLMALAQRHEVLATARQVTGAREPRVTWIRADLSRPADPWELPAQIDAVVYLAQSRRYRESLGAADDILAVNVHSFCRLVEYARRAGAGHFVFTSTASVYRASRAPLDEQAPLDLQTLYSTSKRMAEMTLEAYRAAVPSTILRLFTLYGPGQQGGLVADLADRVRNGRTVTLSGDCGLALSPLYVTDACEAVGRVIDQPPASGGVLTYNVGGTEEASVRSLAEVIADIYRIEPQFESRDLSPAGWVVDGRKFAATGWAPTVPLTEGLRRTIGSSAALS